MEQMEKRNLCTKGSSHTGKEIIMICLNTECDAKRLCCLTCIDQLHRKHQLISIYKFQQMLAILSQQGNPEVRIEVVKLIKIFEGELEDSLLKLGEQFKKALSQCQLRFTSLVQLIYKTIDFNISGQEVKNKLYSNFTNEQVGEYLRLIAEADNMCFKNVQSTVSSLKVGHTSFIRHIKECEKFSLQGVEEVKKGIQKLQLLLYQRSKGKLKWFSKIHKAACIEISESQDSAKRGEGSGGYPIVLVDQPLTQINDNVNVKIVEQPGNKGVWMGVCLLEVVKNFNFASCYGMGKGTWAIDQVGQNHASAYSWSHHDSNYNSQPKVGFQFQVGDIVNIRVDFNKAVVIFSKGDDKYQQPIKLGQGDIYAFVGPTHLGDTLSIV